ncbi:hypothetical protein FRB93_008417 [Tulasnella sp. JGI-2019a]|nr:hypothetical protein FRB93_008417 [Tulasnella sp. JGI-2019a]
MPVIEELTDLQLGSFWGGFVEAFLVGIYSCLFVVTLWTPITTRRPLTIIGWTIIAIYCLTLGRAVTDACVFHRTLFVNGGELPALKSIDYGLRAIQHAFIFVVATLADGLFCWRLYVIWLRSIRVILFPALLLMIHTMICIAAVATDLLLALQPFRMQYLCSLRWYLTGEVVTASLYTLYNTVLIAGRLRWAGHESKKFGALEEVKGNRYGGAIAALVQSGVVYLITMLLMLSALLTKNMLMISVVTQISAIVNGISATLLILQLNLFQERILKHNVDDPPLTTGATFRFAGLETPSLTSRKSSAYQSSVITCRRASMSMVEGRHSGPSKSPHVERNLSHFA